MLWLLVAALLTRYSLGLKNLTGSKPNLVFILVDDLGYNDCWLPQCDLVEAWPNVRALAEEGIAISTYYTTWLCTPTRGAFMTGRYPTRLGLQHQVITGYQDFGLPLNETTLADKLVAVGYETHHVGKWHLGTYSTASMPQRRGFNTTFGYLNGEEDHWTHYIDGYYDLHDGTDYSVGVTYNGTFGAYLFAAAAVDVVRSASDPFFLYYALQNTHQPLEAPDEYLDSVPCASIPSDDNYANSSRVYFCAMAKLADDGISNVTREINTSSTLVVVAGDNGGIVQAGGNNWPLRGQKSTPWEGGVRNHALFWGYGIEAAANGKNIRYYDLGLVHVTDIHAAFVGLAGATNPYEIDGVDVLDAIINNSSSPRTELLTMYDPCSMETPSNTSCSTSAYSYIYRNYKLVKPGALNDSWYAPPSNDTFFNNNNINNAPSRFHPGPNGGVYVDEVGIFNDDLQIFDLSVDPEERVDLTETLDTATTADLILRIHSRLSANLQNEMAPCNIPPNGTCYDDDPNGNLTDGALAGYWCPWIID